MQGKEKHDKDVTNSEAEKQHNTPRKLYWIIVVFYSIKDKRKNII